MKVATINIRYKNENDGNHHWKYRLPILSDYIKKCSLNILATQEGRKDQINELATVINLKLIDGHRDWIEERMYPSLFYNTQQLKLIDSGDVWLSETPSIPGSSSFKSSFPRLLTWAKFEDNGQIFLVANFHLDHVLNSTRLEQVKVGIIELKKIHNDLPIIILGDFNDSPESNTHREICQNLNLIDPWILNGNFEEASHHNFTGDGKDGSRIDWILFNEKFHCNEINLEKRMFNNLYLSDHFPVVATLIPNWR